MARNERWLRRTTRVFPMGSCFARNFSRWLAMQGGSVCDTQLGMHYSPILIKKELEILVGASRPDFPFWIDQVGDQSLLTAKTRHPFSARDRHSYDESMDLASRSGTAALQEAEAFLFTYGLSDIAQERCEGEWISLNRMPPAGTKTGPLRSTQMKAAEVSAVTADIVNLVREIKPKAPIVFSVSPIPLKETYSRNDLCVTNSISKSTLISGLGEYLRGIDAAHNRIYYYPAYEMVVSGRHPFEAWQVDGRHPTAQMISHVCSLFALRFRASDAEFNEAIEFHVPQVDAAGRRVL